MFDYLEWGISSFFFLLVLFTILVPNKDKIDNAVWFIKWPLLFVFALGYIGDIIWNYVFGSPLHYILDRWSGLPHEHAVFLPRFLEPVTIKRTYLLTFTYRLKYIKLTSAKTDKTYIAADFACRRLLEPTDPGHCSIDRYLKNLGAK